MSWRVTFKHDECQLTSLGGDLAARTFTSQHEALKAVGEYLTAHHDDEIATHHYHITATKECEHVKALGRTEWLAAARRYTEAVRGLPGYIRGLDLWTVSKRLGVDIATLEVCPECGEKY